MTDDLTRREIGISLAVALPGTFGLSSGTHGPRVETMLQSVAFASTLADARNRTFDKAVGVVIMGGLYRPGDEGAGQVMIRNLAVDSRHVVAEPSVSFVDKAGTVFSMAMLKPSTAVRGVAGVDDLIARMDLYGIDPWIGRSEQDPVNGQMLQAVFDRIVRSDAPTPTVRLPWGHWSLGTTPLVLAGRRTSIIGQGISVTYLNTEIAVGQTALTLRNYGGETMAFTLDAGASAGSQQRSRQSLRNGILFDWSGGHGTIRSIETRWFSGFGMRFVNIWDSIIENIITVGCGTTDAHAIEFVAAGDTTNHTNINRLQAENSIGRAILFDEKCLNMCVDNIHCEGTVGKRGQYAISLLGSAMSYRNGRFANNGGNVEVLLGGASNVYDRLSFEDGIVVDYATGELGSSRRSFITHSIFDNLRIISRNRGELIVEDCTIARLEIADQAQSVTMVRCIIGEVVLTGNQTDVSMDSCDITGHWKSEGNPTLRARGCRMTNGPDVSQVHLHDCTIQQNYISLINQQVHTTDCRFIGNIVLDNDGARFWLAGNFEVAGDLQYRSGNAFGACAATGTVAGLVHPHWYGVGGVWPRQTLRARPDASRGDVPYTKFDGKVWSAALPLT